jgi:hypothetical protein
LIGLPTINKVAPENIKGINTDDEKWATRQHHHYSEMLSSSSFWGVILSGSFTKEVLAEDYMSDFNFDDLLDS